MNPGPNASIPFRNCRRVVSGDNTKSSDTSSAKKGGNRTRSRQYSNTAEVQKKIAANTYSSSMESYLAPKYPNACI